MEDRGLFLVCGDEVIHNFFIHMEKEKCVLKRKKSAQGKKYMIFF